MQKRRFITADDGAITIDWVALAAGLLILSVGIIGLFTEELQTVTDEIELQLTAATLVTPPSENTMQTFGTGGVDSNGNEIIADENDFFRDLDGSGGPSTGDDYVILAEDVTQEEIDAAVAGEGRVMGTYVLKGTTNGSEGRLLFINDDYNDGEDVIGYQRIGDSLGS